MSAVAYGRNWEDVLLARVFPTGYQGFYVHVGARDPVDGSVTKRFYDLGWTGVNVEPVTERFDRFLADRERDVNLMMAVSDREGAGTADEMTTTTLAGLCETHVGLGRDIDFLTVNVPRVEREVLEGGDWQRWRPRLVLVEGDRVASGGGVGHEGWEKILVDAGYLFATFNGLTRFYVREEDGDLLPGLTAPANAFDDFVPYALATRVRDLSAEVDSLRREVAASSALNEAMRSSHAGFRQADALRSQCRDLEVACAGLQAQCDEARAAMSDLLSRYEQLRKDVIVTRIETAAAQSVLQSVGPSGLAVAQRLARISLRFPGAGAAAKRSARLAARVKRAFRSS